MSMTFGALIYRTRTMQDLSLSDLSRRVGVDEGTISRIEHDQMAGSVTIAARVCLGLGLTYSDVIDALEGEKTPPAIEPTTDQRGAHGVLTAEDVESVVALCRRDAREGRDLIVSLLDLLSQEIAGGRSGGERTNDVPPFPPTLADTLLAANRYYDVTIHYPPDLPSGKILDAHQRGGAIIPADVVAYIQQTRPDLPMLPKKSSDAIQRIVTGQTERLRLADVVALRDDAGLPAGEDMAAMFWSAVTLRIKLLGLEPTAHGPDEQAERIGTGLVTIGSWFQAQAPSDGAWLSLVRRQVHA